MVLGDVYFNDDDFPDLVVVDLAVDAGQDRVTLLY